MKKLLIVLFTTSTFLNCILFKESELDPDSPLSILLGLNRLLNLSRNDACQSSPNWNSFVGTIDVADRFSFPTNLRASTNSDLYAFMLTDYDYGNFGIGFQGTVGSATNFYLSKFSGSGSPIWNRYIGRRSDRPDAMVLREGDGLYVLYTVSDTAGATLPPNPIVSYPSSGGSRAVLIKLSEVGDFLWTRPFTDGTNGDGFVSAFNVIERLDKTSLYVLGGSVNGLTSPGNIIGTQTGDNWFVQEIGFNGNAISTRYLPLPNPYSSFRPTRLVEIPNNGGFYIIAYVSADINSANFSNELNIYPTVATYMVAKFDAIWSYQWHRHLGESTSVTPEDSNYPLSIILANGNLLTSSVYSGAILTIGQPYPGGSDPSTVLFEIAPNGNLLNSSFVYKTTSESVVINNARVFSGNRIYMAGSIGPGSSIGFISDLNTASLSENERTLRQENYVSDVRELCDGSFGTIGYATSGISSSSIPFGIGSANSLFSRFKK
ncbi:MAG: hypothetical protein GW938_06195 [Leptospira sp.]|nr:hypothetical protein [Leptospira sp.]NCS92640.1 hypothetical protein [Leptospira sp.]